MQLFTTAQQAQIRALYGTVTAALKARYGPSVLFQGVQFQEDAAGAINSMQITVTIQTPPDPDGATAWVQKQVEVWK